MSAVKMPPEMVEGMKAASEMAKLVLLRASDIKPEAIDWLWKAWIAAGKLHLIGGQPGTGKTTIALALAAAITNGGRWPDGSRAEAGSVAMWSGEDDPRDTLVPRLIAAGANVDKVRLVAGISEKGERRAFDPATDADLLAEALADIDDLRLLIVDPLVSAVAGDSHKNAEVRRGLQPLVDLAQRHRCALVGITHFSKGTAGREPLERVTGSLAFGALARIVLVTAKSNEAEGSPARRFLARAKSNIGPDGDGFAYDLEEIELPGYPGVETSVIRWGAALQGSARELLGAAEEIASEADRGHDEAQEFLRELLAHGARSSKEVFAEASGAGFSRDQMHRAKRKIGATAIKRGMDLGWSWVLPEGSAPPPKVAEGGAQNRAPSSLPSALPSADPETLL